MNMIEHYFKFVHLPDKAKSRYELKNLSMPVYEPLNLPFIYFGNTPEHIKARQKRKSDFGISQKHWISSVFIPDISKPNIAYGDLKNTIDLILIIILENELELFVCRNKKHLFQSILNLYNDGELNSEIQEIKSKANIFEGQILEIITSKTS